LIVVEKGGDESGSGGVPFYLCWVPVLDFGYSAYNWGPDLPGAEGEKEINSN